MGSTSPTTTRCAPSSIRWDKGLRNVPFAFRVDDLSRMILDKPISPGEGIIHQAETVDFLPANIKLSGLEVTLVNTMSRETILRDYLNSVREPYAEILLDCCPSLGTSRLLTSRF